MRWRWLVAIIAAIAVVAGGFYWVNRPVDPYRSLVGGVSVQQDAPDSIRATEDNRIAKLQLNGVQPLGPVVHITPDGPLNKTVTLRFNFNRKIDDPRDVVIAVNQTGKADGWQLVPLTDVKVEGQYAYVTTNHLSWWQALWHSFKDVVNAVTTELKNQWDGLTGGAFADAEKPKCDNEKDARDKGYAVSWKGAEVLYWCLGLDRGKPVVRIVNKRRYPILVNHAGITVPNPPKAKFGVEWLARKSFSDKRTVMLPFDQIQLNYDLGKGQAKTFTTEYNGFAESLYQLEFGVTTLINILTRFGAGGGMISNGAIKITQFDRVAEAMSKVLTLKDCTNALNTDSPNVGAIISGCFSPDAIMTMFGWKGVLVALVMVVAPVINFFTNTFETLGDLLQGKDQEKVTVSYNPPAPPAPPTVMLAGTWFVHGAKMVIKSDGTGTYSWNAGPCPTETNQFEMCQGNAALRFTVTGAGMTGTYAKVWYTRNSDGGSTPGGFPGADPSRVAGKTFTIKRNDPHTLITSDGTGSRPGNPYLCDAYAEAHNNSTYMLCGA
jgi:hypothetical protein